MTALDPSDETLFAFQRNVVVAASAGTGKTHRLAALYVLLTLGLTSMGRDKRSRATRPTTPERIVATTFSRAAAREIRERVEGALRAIAAWDGRSELPFEDILRARAAEIGEPLDPIEVCARAADAVALLPRARIDTLHGVAAEIVRAHAIELGLAPAMRVLEEDEARALADLAIDETLAAALDAGGDVAEAARDLVAACSGVALARTAVARLVDRLDEEGISPALLVRADHVGEAAERRVELDRVVRASAEGGNAKFQPVARALATLLDGARESELPLEVIPLLTDLFAVRMPPQGKRTPADQDLYALRNERKALPADRAADITHFLREAPRLAAREASVAKLLEDARSRMIAARRRQGALSFGDLLRAARDGLLADPDLRQTAGEDIDVLLVDEFQDTSRVQRDLVYLLRERDDASRARAPGAAPKASGLLPHGLFVVGDRKQSIYGFRGADVAVFARVCAELAGAAAGQALAIPREAWADVPVADFIALRESRRSGPRVLSFVNAFSTKDFAGDRSAGEAPRDFEVAYGEADELHAHTGRGDKPDEVILALDDGTSPADAPPLVVGAEGPLREAFVAAGLVAKLAREGARLGDVAVLARRRKTISLLEFALGRLEIPYVVAGRALYDAREVRDVAAVLRLVLDPKDRLALATVLRGPVVALSDSALVTLSVPSRGLDVALGRPPSAEQIAAMERLDPENRARLDAFRARFADLRPTALRAPPGEAIRALVAGFDLDRTIAALPRAEARLGNVDRLISIARRRGGTLASFSRWLDRRIDEEADELEAAVFSPDDDAVRLTTIHASKGLDFPIVVLVDLNHEPRPQYPGVDVALSGAPKLSLRHVTRATLGTESDEIVDKAQIRTPTLRRARTESLARERAERRRLTYVALTRARNTLAIVAPAGRARGGSTWGALATMLGDPTIEGAITRREEATDLLDVAPRAKNDAPSIEITTPVKEAAPARRVVLATTSASIFHGCARRFRFRHLLALEEPVASGQLDLFDAPVEDAARDVDESEDADPRSLGRAAHRVLERWPRKRWGEPTEEGEILPSLVAEGLENESAEARRIAIGLAAFLSGPYAQSLRAASADLRREDEFVLPIQSPSDRELALRGAIDLLASMEGRVDVVDYKLSSPRRDLSPYGFQLRAYALAARSRNPGAAIRAGVLFLGHADSPQWLAGSGPDGTLADADLDVFARDLGALADRFARARARDRWDGIPVSACRALRCGFVKVCHPKIPRSRG